MKGMVMAPNMGHVAAVAHALSRLVASIGHGSCRVGSG